MLDFKAARAPRDVESACHGQTVGDFPTGLPEKEEVCGQPKNNSESEAGRLYPVGVPPGLAEETSDKLHFRNSC